MQREAPSSSTSTLVWVPHEKEVWKKAQVIQKVSEFQVEVRIVGDKDDGSYDPEDGVMKTLDVREIAKLAGEVSATAMPICNTFSKLGVADMCTLNHLHEPAVLKNLQLRHALSVPYTYTGQICIAVNPYKWLDLYRKDLYDKSLELPRDDLPPHPFALSSSSYIDMQENGIEQSILVSGESGAGKTETVKIMMNHLASISGGGDQGSLVIDQVLKSNPLLEAFGNAKTKRNDNSSRFGKFAQLQFNKEGLLVGARCETYLLEKSRVVGQAQGERNYHIFYQVFSLAHEVKKTLSLDGSVGDYSYVKVGEGSKVDNIDDSEYLQETKDAMDTIGIDYREQQGIFEVVSSILNLGEIDFKAETSETCSVMTLDRLESIAKLLQTDSSKLQAILTHRTMAARGETFTIPLNAVQAADLRDAFAKGIYSQLFDWLVTRVNNAICSTRSVKHHIGLLDIFGFESFDHNGFEQLCINYANEKLQQKFNSDIFKTVQTEYISEGIPLELVSFEDNQPILDLIEGRLGLVDLLNETGVLAKATDAAFVSKIHEAFASHKNFEKVRMNTMQFKILHYAGEVVYNGEHFLEKNKDTLPPDMLELLASSKSPFIRDVFPEMSKSVDKNKPGRRQGFLVGATIANSFRKQLGELMEQIAKTTTQYVRCIKPNANKSANEFDRQMVVDQLRCAGVIAAIRISRAAFPNRLTLVEFARRFDIICPSKLRKAAPEAMVLGLLDKLGITESSSQNAKFAIGKSKVYFSSGLLQYLEEQRIVVLRKQAILIQKNMRAFAKRKQFKAIQKATLVVQRFTRGWMARRRWRIVCLGVPKLQSAIRGFVQRNKFRVLLAESRERNRLRLLAEAQANAQTAVALQQQMQETVAVPPPVTHRASLGSPYFNGEIPESPKKKYPAPAVSAHMREEMTKKIDEAQAMAEQARQAAKEAMQLNAALQVENEQLKAKLAKNARDYADDELRVENERLRSQLAALQSKIIRADEVALISAKVVDSRITYRDGKQFVEYKLQIETNNRGTLFVWHRYSTFRNLATTLQTKNGYARKDIPELPNKTLFGNFSDKIVQERIEKLNSFLEAATNADYLQWGIRIDAETCVYKRRVKGSSSRDSMVSVSRDTMTTMTPSMNSPTHSDSSTTSGSDSSSFRRSFFGRSKK
ncbi:Aste57867_12527 [Aphanomyces stellatus]|uniref:Aste57867_12527 protein n=1 Tax=Aphanomyces stellatus TaxID=120398 RepID=A0A485KX69_9STRA|nr:hypothetical protein As57867_012481 [Aphanomyces stellatus]VFT89378.1 Aste57867_12527 [Aphanomyces stellatus]